MSKLDPGIEDAAELAQELLKRFPSTETILERVAERQRQLAILEAFRRTPYAPGIVREGHRSIGCVVITNEAITPASSWANLERIRAQELERTRTLMLEFERYYDEEDLGLMPRYRVRCEACPWRGYRINYLAEIFDERQAFARRPCPRCGGTVVPVRRVPHPPRVLDSVVVGV